MTKKRRKRSQEEQLAFTDRNQSQLRHQRADRKVATVEKNEERNAKKESEDGRFKFRIVLCLLSLVIYLNSLKCGFVYDDRRAILQNRNVLTSQNNWSQLLNDDFWGTPMSNPGSHKSYRPLVTLTYRLQTIRMWSDEQHGKAQLDSGKAFAFHLVNLLLHLVVVDLVFQMARKLCQATLCRSTNFAPNECDEMKRKSDTISCLTSLLFACHPVHVEAVTSLVGRAELMGTAFVLLSFRSMLAALSLPNKLPVWGPLLKSTLYAACACLSKENAATVIPINILFIVWHQLGGCGGHVKLRRGAAGAGLLAMLSLLIAFASLRVQLNMSPPAPTFDNSNLSAPGEQHILPTFSHLDNPLAQSARQFCLRNQKRLQSLIGQSSLSSNHPKQLETSPEGQLCSDGPLLSFIEHSMLVTRLYIPAHTIIKLLLWPSELSYDWPLETIAGGGLGLIESTLDLRFLFALLVYITLVLFTVRCFWKRATGSIALLLTLIRAENFQTIETIDRMTLWPNQTEVQPYSPRDSSRGGNEEEEEEDRNSETSSIKSEGTIKSTDSGFASSSGSGQTSARASPCSFGELEGEQVKLRLKNGKRFRTIEDRFRREALECLLVWALLWLVLPYLPASNLLLPVGFLMAERTLYLPSFGFCLAAGILLNQLASFVVENSQNRLLSLLSDSVGHKRTTTKSAFWQMVLVFRSSAFWKSHEAKFTAKLLLISPLLILGSLKTVSRNEDWRNERALFSSNLRHSRSKSMANLASLEAMTPSGNPLELPPAGSNERVWRLYQEALSATSGGSAELHYNLALAMQTANSRNLKQIEYHYKLALKLRPNFPLAALNLGSIQFAKLNQPHKALESFRVCAFSPQMSPRKSKTFKQHVQTQVECLISGAKVMLGSSAKDQNGAKEVGEWMQVARQKAEQAGEGSEEILEGSNQFGELNRQLALISWLEARLDKSRAGELLEAAVRYAAQSSLVVEAQVYLSYLEGAELKLDATSLLESIIKRERAKRGFEYAGGRQQVAILHHKLSELYRSRGRSSSAMRHIEAALEIEPKSPIYLTFGAELSYQMGNFNRSENLYSETLSHLTAIGGGCLKRDKQPGPLEAGSGEQNRKLARAHVNYGAILQVNGQRKLALEQYRMALDCDQTNSVAAANFANLKER